MAGQTMYYAGQTVPTIAGQTVPYLGQIERPVASLTAPLTTVPTGDAAKPIQVEKTEADTVAANSGGLAEASGQSNRQPLAGLTDGLQPV
uniref:Uncharacterized protein n=1 Tax=Oryza sativa subsp. japonica TaxID=39947 RepID=Q69IT1_ORYSJ|nr:hypothetical protein [Oryza sativa Japonica Group]